MGGYRALLRLPGIIPVLVLSALVKMPIVAIPIVITLRVVLGLGEGFAEAGVVVALWTVGAAVGGPWQGRAIDRYGIRRVLLITAAAQLLFWAVLPALSLWTLAVSAVVAGTVTVQGFTVARLAMAATVPEEHRKTGFAVDSITTEIAYMSGPAIGILFATQVSPTIAVWCVGGALVVAGVAFGVLDPSVEHRSVPAGTGRVPIRSWLRIPLLGVLIATTASTIVVGGWETAIVGTLRHLDQVAWGGIVLGACGVFSLIGGLIYGASRHRPSPFLLVGLMALAIVPVGLSGDWLWLCLALLPATALCAPSFAATADAVSALAPPGTNGVVMGSYSAALTIGNAIGAPLAGATLDHADPIAAFAVIGVLGAVATAAAWLLSTRSPAAASAPTTTEPAVPATEGVRPTTDLRSEHL